VLTVEVHDRSSTDRDLDDAAAAADAAASPTGASSTVRAPSTWLVLTAAASAAAGLVHAAAAGSHSGDDTLVRLFAVTAVVQVAWAAIALARPARPVLAAGLVVNGGAVLAWALQRTRGLPWPAVLEEPESVGTQDLLAAGLGAAAAVGALALLLRPALLARRPGAPLSRTALVGGVAILALAAPAMAAPHDSGHHDGEAAHGDEAAHDDGHAAHDDSASATGPVISLADSRVTEDERTAAQDLIDTTADGMARFSDPESVAAAGYVSIGDAVTGYEHYINVGYLADGIELDPERIESIVFTVAPDGTRTLASAMYILTFGKTMDDVPEIAGELTSWHDHQNLCWEGVRVVGTTDRTGSCERGTFRGTAPMLHVWVTEHECGPFAGIEGSHGQSCGDHGH
jgi:hypothetical protein